MTGLLDPSSYAQHVDRIHLPLVGLRECLQTMSDADIPLKIVTHLPDSTMV